MLTQRKPLLLSALVLALSLTACQRPDAKNKDKTGPSATLQIAAEDVVTVGSNGLIGGPVLTGSIQAARRADLRAEVAAVVLQVTKDNGEPVRQGDVIVRLDSTAIRDNLTSAEEALRAATQSFEQTERVLQRQRTLNQQGMTSMQALEDAELRRNAAQSELAAARARVVSAKQQMTRTEIKAPFDGVVSERKVSVGDTVQVGREIVKVVDPRSLRFEGQVSADRLGEIRVGQAVALRVNGVSEGEYSAKLERIDAAANPTTRQVEVMARFDNPAQAPKVAGLYAEGRVNTGAKSALVLAESSLVRQGEEAFVWRLDGDRLKKVSVQLGERDARRGEWVIQSGLKLGDEVLRSPAGQLADGQALRRAGQKTPPVAAASSASAAQR
ncbi:efflux RND transporter periplasmic adaptor subunit [Inhella gelatinilytica]|uniref:Efflux RND transporter periplasmic adaptor subunit n=1 Tax=Inhella gelatinilytica TaxID=2795030 RepID=A0A931IX87_9BURK|nr:efflux RND transporter periplasmic adaptor subunit [Inhella gelatinilytica]MBH9553839.1 efflux RND transporter periplasmic adaptor subunit [Inhella gelatinilytica]